MSEEIFRFSVVRNPKSLSPEQLAESVIELLPDAMAREHPFSHSLITMVQQGASRAAIIEEAERIITDPKFMTQLNSLKTPLFAFNDRLQIMRKPSASDIRKLVNQIFGKSIGELAEDPGFKADKQVISDSLVVASIVNPSTPGLRTRLMQTRRAVELIDLMAKADANNFQPSKIENLLKATILLPLAIFPLPDNTEERRRANLELYEKKKEALNQQRERAQGLLNEIAANELAVDEVTQAFSRHLLRNKLAEDDPNIDLIPILKGNPLLESISVLPKNIVEQLSSNTRAVIVDGLHLSTDEVDVIYITEQIEKRNTYLSHILATEFSDLLSEFTEFDIPISCGDCPPLVLTEPKPENTFVTDTRGKVEIVGVQDLLIVRQDLLEYRTGEIAHIENILKGEKKLKKHRKLDRTEITIVEERENEKEIEEELQTTDKYELQTETSRVIHEDRSIEAGVTVTASYGTVDIEAHGNYAQNNSSDESRRAASNFAHDVISRSLQRIRERVLTRRSRTDITEIEIINDHEFSNIEGTEHIRGVYRWVDKFYQAQIVNYGKRTMLEFMIPEPAAFYKYAASNKPTSVKPIPEPERPGFCRDGMFHPLTPADIQPENYMCFVAKYNVSNIQPPPPHYIKLSDVLKYKSEGEARAEVAFAENNASFKVSEGYLPIAVSYTITGGNSHRVSTPTDERDDIIHVVITIADRKVFRYFKNEIGKTSAGDDNWPDIGQVIEWGQELSQIEKDFGGYSEGSLSGSFSIIPLNAGSSSTPDALPDVVKVSITGHSTLLVSASIHYSVLCERSAAKFQQWQIDTFNAIQEAYLVLRQEYEESQQSPVVTELLTIQGRNPLINREIEKRELKKFATSLLTGQQFESFNAMEEDYALHIPQINLKDAAAEGPFVRFFEQALEWKHLTYILYPYFWGKKSRWVETINLKDTDPIFEQFLQAGYARVWVPVRPGFELVMKHYIKCGGEPWTERDAPQCEEPQGDSAVLALIEEMKEQLNADFETREGTLTVRKGKTLVKGTGTDFHDDDIDREILIALKYYRIAKVDIASQEIHLREPYAGKDQENIGFAIGVKFVGEPWVVQVPTNLVYLDKGTSIISESE